MKKYTNVVNTFTETILGVFLLGIILVSFFATTNISTFTAKEGQNNVLGTYTYSDVFNPNIFSSNEISISKSDLESGGNSLTFALNTSKSEFSTKVMTIYNKYDYKLKVNVVLDITEIDGNANYYLLVNDQEKLIKDSYRPDQYNYILEIEPKKETSIGVKIKSLQSIETNFNIIFGEI